MNKNIFRSDGRYIGFVKNDFLYERDGIYIGWLDGKIAWDERGLFKGVLQTMNGKDYYIWRDKYAIPPTPRTSRRTTDIQAPDPPPNIPAISLPTGLEDGFFTIKE